MGTSNMPTLTQVLPDLEKVEELLTTEPGDHDKFAHYVSKRKVTEAHVLGIPIIALCGKIWIPNRDPAKFTVCPECKEIYESYPEPPEGSNG